MPLEITDITPNRINNYMTLSVDQKAQELQELNELILLNPRNALLYTARSRIKSHLGLDAQMDLLWRMKLDPDFMEQWIAPNAISKGVAPQALRKLLTDIFDKLDECTPSDEKIREKGLRQAAYDGNFLLVKRLVDAQVNMNGYGESGRPATHWVCRGQGNIDQRWQILTLLLEKNAENLADVEGNLFVHHLILCDNFSLFSRMLPFIVAENLTKANANGWTVISLLNSKIMELTFKMTANNLAADSPLMLAARNSLREARTLMAQIDNKVHATLTSNLNI